MDLTAQQQAVNDLTAKIAAETATIETDKAQLVEAEKTLAFGVLINQLEALAIEDLAVINDALKADNSTLVLSESIPSEAATDSSQS